MCALHSLWVVPQRRPPAQSCIQPGCFCCCPHLRQMASLSRLQPETRPGDGSERGGNLPLQIPGTNFIWTRLGSTRSAANPAQTPRYTVTLPTNGSGIHPKKVCAAKIINDLDCNGAVIADCGGSQGSLWKHSILPVICAESRREHSKHNRKRKERETTGSFSGSVEPKSKQLSRALTWSTCGNSSHVMKLHRPLNLIPKPQPQIQHLFAVHCSTLKRLR